VCVCVCVCVCVYIGKSSGKQDHYDLSHDDELISTCSFIDITIFTCILILCGLSRKNLLAFKKNV